MAEFSPSRSHGHEQVRQKVCRQRRSERARPPRAPFLAAPLPRLLGWQQWSGLCDCPGPSYPPSRAQVDKTMRVAATLPVSSCRARRRARGARREHTRLCECTREGGTRLWCCPGPVYALWVAPGGDLGRDRGVRANAVTLGRGAPHAADVVTRTVARRAIIRMIRAGLRGADGRDGGSGVLCGLSLRV